MTSLHVRVGKRLPHGGVRLGAIARLLPVRREDNPARGAQPQTGIVVPVGWDDPPASLQAEPGCYLVEATLPSGELVSRYVTVPQQGEIEVVLEAQDSPHAALAMQHYLGQVPSRERVEQLRRERPACDADGGGTTAVSIASSPRYYRIKATRDTLERERRLAGAELSDADMIAYLFGGLSAAVPLQPIAEGPFRRIALMPTQQHAAADETASDLGALFGPPAGSVKRSYFALVEGSRLVHVSVLPLEWRHVGYGDEPTGMSVPVEIVVGPDCSRTAEEGARRVCVAVADSELGAMLGYLARNDFPSALAVFQRTAGGRLFAQYDSPLTGILGGYVLCEAEDEKIVSRAQWKEWLAAVAAHSPWLPDAGIQLALLLIETFDQARLAPRGEELDPVLEEARELLVSAVAAGPPFFCMGVRMLVDGLTLIANADRLVNNRTRSAQATRRALEVARWLALRADPAQTFTVLRL